MNREWLPILWILIGIFLLIALFSVWNRKESRGRRQQALHDRQVFCTRLMETLPQHEIQLDMSTCMRMLSGVPAGRRNAYRTCLQQKETTLCLLDTMCRDVREPVCAWAATVAWEHSDHRAEAQKKLVRLCEKENSIAACTQLLRISQKSPEKTNIAGSLYWQSQLCRITGRTCSRMQTSLLPCLRIPLSHECQKQLVLHPDPVALFLACEALSGSACRQWAYMLFPHTTNPNDAYWSNEKLAYLCTLQDVVSCAQLGHRLNQTNLVHFACRQGIAEACQELLGIEQDPLRISFLQWRRMHPPN